MAQCKFEGCTKRAFKDHDGYCIDHHLVMLHRRTFENIAKKDPDRAKFFKYLRVQESGKYNMIMDANAAAQEAELSLDDYFYVIKNYSELRKRYITQ